LKLSLPSYTLAWSKRTSAHFENDYSGMPVGFQHMADSFWVKLTEASRQEPALASSPNTTPLNMVTSPNIARHGRYRMRCKRFCFFLRSSIPKAFHMATQ
jgi:hypothetical protein